MKKDSVLGLEFCGLKIGDGDFLKIKIISNIFCRKVLQIDFFFLVEFLGFKYIDYMKENVIILLKEYVL